MQQFVVQILGHFWPISIQLFKIWAYVYEEQLAPLLAFIFQTVMLKKLAYVEPKQDYPAGLNTFKVWLVLQYLSSLNV